MMTSNKRCRICKSDDLDKFLELGEQPPANAFLTEEQLEAYCSTWVYPLDVYFCKRCGLIQLLDIVSPDLLFRDYAYFTGKSSETMKKHFLELASSLTNDFCLTKKDLVVDIGSNDGTLLKNFRTRVLGVDPAMNLVEEAQKNGVPTLCGYFGAGLAFDIIQKFQEAKVITATNVFAHVNNLYDLMAGVCLLLKEDGVFVIEVPHFLELYRRKEFDTIYHEHLSYFLSKPINNLVTKFGMNIFKIEKTPVHGGSIRCYIGRKFRESSFLKIFGEEIGLGLYKPSTYETFSKEVGKIKSDLLNLLIELKSKGKRIVGYGAPAKGNTLINYCGIGKYLDYLTDTTPYKQGRYSPGARIPVVSPDILKKDKPDYALMLPWNYEKEILKKEKEFIKNGGKFIVPIPTPRIIP